MATGAATYLKNIGKSVGYSMIDTIKDSAPAMTAFASNNGDAIKSTYQAIRHMDKTAKQMKVKILQSEYGDVGRYALANIKDDLRSGKFYNLERKRSGDTEALKDLGFGEDDDFGFEDLANMDDFDMDGGESLESMVDLVGKKASEAVSDAVIRTTEYAVNAQTELTRATAEQNKAIYANLHSAIGTVNENIGKLIEIANGPMTTHFENSQKFFEAETKLSEERNAILKEMLELQRGVYAPKNKKPVDGKISMADIMDEHGMPDLSTYFEAVKKNIDNLSAGTGDLIKSMLTPDMLKSLVSSPLQFATDFVAKQLFPNLIKESVKNLDKTVSGAFSSIMAKVMNTEFEGALPNFLKSILGIADNTKTNIDTSKYEKGAVPFDGITRKSIVEVIPTYLARIESAITKQTERRFDFESGKFIGVDEIKDIAKNNKGSAERYANFDVKQYLDRYMKAINFKDSKRRKQVQENIDRILSKSFDTAVLFNPKVRDDLPSDYGMKGDDLDYQLKMIKQMFKAIPKEVVAAYAQNVYEAKGQYSRQMRAKEESGTSIEAALYNNSMKGMAYDRSAQMKEQVKKDTTMYRGERSRSKDRARRNSGSNNRSATTKTQSSDDGDPDAAKDAVFTYDAEDYEGLEDGVVAALMVLNEEDKKSSDSKNKKSIFEKLQESTTIGSGIKKFVKGIDYLLHKPTEFLAGIIKKADNSIYNLIFGVEYDEETGEKKSISKAIFDGLKETFQDFKDWMRKYVFDPIKKYFDKEGTIGNRAKKFVQGKYKQFKESDFGNRFFGTFKKAGAAVKDTARNAAESIMSGDQDEVSSSDILSELLNSDRSSNKKPKLKDIGKSNIDNNAKGSRRVKKTGLAVLSEGEMIIPPDLNPLNIAKRNKKENKIKDDFLSNIPNFGGGKGNFTVIEGGKGKTESSEEASNYAIAEEWNKKMETNLEGAKQEFAQLPRKAQDKIIKALKKYELGQKAGKLVQSIGKQLSSAAKSIYERGKEAWNNNSTKPGEEDRREASEREKELKALAQNGFKEIQKYAPEVAAGGIIGGGVSLLTGAIGGPLVGAAVGAGISLLKNSEKFNQMLFGDVGEDGKRHGGIIKNEKISMAIQKYAPSMGKGAILGGISSFILPFGPLAGIMLGSAAGFAKENEDVHKALFGDEGLFGKDFDKKVKKALPAMGAGALVGAVAGPFGLVPNLILGSAAGLGVTTDKFKDFMFGKEDKDGVRHGGLIENAVQNMFKPMVDFTKNTMKDLKDWADKNIKEPLKHFVDPVKQQFRLIFRSIHEGINGLFKEHLGATMDDLLKETFGHITGFIKKITGWALAPIKAVVSAPFKFLGFVGDNLRDRQVRKGNADDMTAAERNAWRDKRKINSRNLTPMSFLTNMLTHPIRTVKNPIETAKSGVDKAYGKASRVAKQDKALEIMGSNEASDLLEILSLVTADEKAVGGTREAIFDRYTEKVRKSGKLKASQVNRIAKELKPLITSDKIRDAASAKKITQHCIGIINRFDDISDEDKLEFNEEIKTFISSMLEHNQRRAAFKKNKQSIIEKITESKSFQDAGLTADDIKEEDLESLIRRLKKEVQYKTIDSKADSELKEANEEFNRKYDENSAKIISHLKNIEESLSFLRNVDSTRTESFNEQLDDITDPDATYWSPKEHVINGVKFGAGKIKQGVKFGARKAKQGATTIKEAVYDSGETIQEVKDKARQNTIDAAKKSKSVEGTGNIIPFPNAAGGGIVDRTGIVAVSEGELIIPPDFSPFNTDKRKKKEDEAKQKFVDSIFGYAEGGEVNFDDWKSNNHQSFLDRMKAMKQNHGNKDKDVRYEFSGGKRYKFIRNGEGDEWRLDKSDSDTAEAIQDDEEEAQQKKTFFKSMLDMPKTFLGSIKKAFNGEEKDNEKTGILGKIFSIFGGGDKENKTGLLGKAIAGIITVPFLTGMLKDFFENTNAGQKISNFAKDLITNLKLDEKLDTLKNGIVDWFQGEGKFEGKGFPGLLASFASHWAEGFEFIMTTVIPKATEILIKALPGMLTGVVRGLGAIITENFHNILHGSSGSENLDLVDKDYKNGSSTGAISIETMSSNNGTTALKYNGKSYNGSSTFSDIFSGWKTSSVDTTVGGNIKIPTGGSLTNKTTSSSSVSTVAQNSLSQAKQSVNDTAKRTGVDPTGTDYKETESYKNLPEAYQKKVDEQLANLTKNEQNYLSITDANGNQQYMTLQQLLANKDVVVDYIQDDTTGEIIPITGQDILNNPNTLGKQFGLDLTITDEERQKNKEEAGLAKNDSLATATANVAIRKFAQGRTGSTLLGTAGRIIKGKNSKNIIRKSLGGTLGVLESATDLAGKAGRSILPDWLIGTSSEDINKRQERKRARAEYKANKRNSGKGLLNRLGGANDKVRVLNNASGGELMTRSQAVAQGLSEEAGDFVTEKKSLMGRAGDALTSAKNKVINSKPVQSIANAATSAKNKAVDIAAGAKDKVVQAGSNVAMAIKDTAASSKPIQTAKRGIQNATEKIADSKLGQGVNKLAESVKNAGASENKGITGKIIDWVTKHIKDIKNNTGIFDKIKEGLKKAGKACSKEAVDKVLDQVIESIEKKVLPTFAEKLLKAGAKTIAKIAGTVLSGGIVGLIFGIGDFISGFNNAKTILGVVDDDSIDYDPSFAVKLACGLVNFINGTFLFGLVPLDTVFNILYEPLKSIMGLDPEDTAELDKARADSQEFLKKINNEGKGTNMTVEEYNDSQKWTTKAVNKIKETAGNLKDGAVNLWNKLTGKDDKKEDKEDKDDKKSDKEKTEESLSSHNTDVEKAQSAVVAGASTIGDTLTSLTSSVINANTSIQQVPTIDQYAADTMNYTTMPASYTDANGNVIDTSYGLAQTTAMNGMDATLTGMEEANEEVTKKTDEIEDSIKSIGSDITTIMNASYKWGTNKSTRKGIDSVKSRTKDEKDSVDPIYGFKRYLATTTDVVFTPLRGLFSLSTKFKTKASQLDEWTDQASTKIKDIKKGSNKSKIADIIANVKSIITGKKNSRSENPLNSFIDFFESMMTIVQVPMSALDYLGESLKNGVKTVANKVSSSIEEGKNNEDSGKGSGLSGYNGRGSNQKPKSDSKYANDPTFVSQLDSKYANQSFNVQGDTQKQTIADSGCGPAAAAMVVNGAYGGQNQLTMKDASKEALKYKVKNGGVNAAYFEDEFSSHGLMTKYYVDGSKKERNEDISSSLRSGNRVVLMGSDRSNTSKVASPYGPDDHYVVATRISPDGKYIWINDPESKVPEVKYPAQKVLNSTKMGVAGVAANGSRLIRHIHAKGSGINKLKDAIRKYAGRGTLPGADVAEQCWNFLRSAGFSDEATAGLLGNFQQESGMRPDALQGGKGPAAGLFQMEKYGDYGSRWGSMAKYAESKGKDWTDLQCQLEFLISEMPSQFKTYTGHGVHTYANGTQTWWPEPVTVEEFKALTDIAKATEIFERTYERASIPRMEQRIKYAQEFYNRFSGKYTQVDGIGSGDTSSGGDDSSSGGSILDDILGVFDDLGEIWGLKKKDTSSSGGTSGSSVAASSSLQEALVNKMKSVEGQLKYSQSQRNPDTGSGDCSSTVQWAYQNVLGVDPGSWTGAQETDDDTYTVTNSFDESQMQQGDMILYNGHVEMYAGDGKMIGHGGGADGNTPGPTIKPLSDQGRFRMIRRWKGFRDGYDSNQIPEQYRSLTGKGSGISKFRSNRAIDPKKMITVDDTYKSSNQKITQNGGFIRRSRYDASMTKDIKIPAGMYAAGTGLDIDRYTVQSKAPTEIRRVSTSSVDNVIDSTKRTRTDKVQAYLAAILKLLAKEVENTNMLSTVVTILTELVKISEEEKELKGKSNTEQKEEELKTRRMSMMNILNATGISGGASPELEKLISEAQRLAAI